MAKKARTPKPPRPAAAGPRPVQAPQRRSGTSRTPKAPSAPTDRFRYFWPISAVVVALAIVGAVLGIVLTRSTPALALKTPIPWGNLPGLLTGRPPWPANGATMQTRLGALHVQALPTEGTVSHTHQHVDIFVDGKSVTIPRYVGISADQSSTTGVQLAELHTHRSDNVIHVESSTNHRFTLGQFFGIWGVRLTSTCLGSFKGGCDNLQFWVNGKKQTGNPADVVLTEHEEIAISVGPTPKHIPGSYNFPSGE